MSNRPDIDGVIFKFYEAVNDLATGQGDVRNRLQSTALNLFVLSDKEIPEEIKQSFQQYKTQMTRFKAEYDEGDIAATMKRIKNSTGQKIAELVFEMYKTLLQAKGGFVY